MEEINEKEESLNKETKPKKNKVLIIVILIVLILAVVGTLLFLIKGKDKKQKTVSVDYKETYENAINTYGDAVSEEIAEYMKKNNGKVPEWDDIKDGVKLLTEKVSCKNTINYDGTLYLENCTVKDVDYKSDYTYGKKVSKPATSNTELYIYYYQYDNMDDYTISSYKYENDNAAKLVNTYKCQSDDCSGYDISDFSKTAVIYDGDSYYLYNFEKNEKNKIDLGKEKIANIYIISSKKSDYGLAISKDGNNKFGLYNLKNNEYISDFIYDYVINYNINELLDKGYFVVCDYNDDKSEVLILNNSTGGIVKKLDNAGNMFSATIGDKVIYGVSGGGNSYTYRLYNSDFQLFTGESNEYEYAINSNNTITLMYSNKNYNIYNSNGEIVLTSKKYQKVVKVVKDYVIVLDDNNDLKLLDLSEKEVVTFLNVSSKYKLHPLISGWYTENDKTGVYMLVEDTTISYGNEGSGLKYYYIPSTKESGVIKTNGIGGYAKPVLYLYPTKSTKINISFEKPYLLTTTYPKYKNSWNVTAHSNGDLYDENNKYYYGLYWEETGTSNVDFSRGFYVTKETAIAFLEEKCNQIGFTPREADEFIMYWLPILEKNKKSLVYFEFTEERDAYNKLNINPVPDSLLRVAIHVKKVDKYTKIKEEKIPTFKRNGFVAVEWGGVIH